MNLDLEAQQDELIALASIYEECFILTERKEIIDLKLLDEVPETGILSIKLELSSPFYVSFINDISKVKEKLCIKHLPPLCLHFTFPSDYPSKSPPKFKIFCKWLTNAQLSHLCRKLDEIWEINQSSEVMFTWAQFLKEETLQELSITDEIEIEKETDTLSHLSLDENKENYEETQTDQRAMNDKEMNTNLYIFLREYDTSLRKQEFDSKIFICNICFDSKGGNQCIEFWPCCHVFCKDCIRSYFEVQIQDGNIKQLKCPENKCSSEANPKQVEELVPLELYKKWDEMLLTSTIYSLDDIQACPRKHCQYPVTMEEGQGHCPMCYFVFCGLCRFGSHGIERCKFKSGEAREILDKYMNGTDMDQKDLEDRYGKKYLNVMVEEYLTVQYMDRNAKECPRCRANIEKIDGCNKITCKRCDSNFCWICEKTLDKINPYGHFNDQNSSCFNLLFQGMNDFEVDIDYDSGDEEQLDAAEGPVLRIR